jgi:hypothetical protein
LLLRIEAARGLRVNRCCRGAMKRIGCSSDVALRRAEKAAGALCLVAVSFEVLSSLWRG